MSEGSDEWAVVGRQEISNTLSDIGLDGEKWIRSTNLNECGSGASWRPEPDGQLGRGYRTHRRVESTLRTLTHDDYTVGWICALPVEMAAATALLDAVHGPLPSMEKDPNAYTFGAMSDHNIVIACLPSGSYGTNNAAGVANNMLRSFPSIENCLVVGVGGGAPGKEDLRLGDVVVSDRTIQYDLGKTIQGGTLQRKPIIDRPPRSMLSAVSKLRADHLLTPTKIPSFLRTMVEKYPLRFTYPSQHQDRLFKSEYNHISLAEPCTSGGCDNCDLTRVVPRKARGDTCPRVFYGGVASGNQVMRDGKTRDQLAKELDILCFEMEASGVMDAFPCLVIRGICDYSDSHKNKVWQEYAAATAAAYAKELLSVIQGPGSELTEGELMLPVDSERHKLLMQSLRSEHLKSRRPVVKPSHGQTCEWLLVHPSYRDWLDPTKVAQHHGFLWIKGKPGAGKSTIMNFAYTQATNSPDITISFFFHARGDFLERSVIGMYHSLLFQLLRELESLQVVFDLPQNRREVDELYSLIITEPERRPKWPVMLLQKLLRSAVDELNQHRKRLRLFVDALDECDESEVEGMIEYFEELGAYAVARGTRLVTCFSSRHYPHINIEYGQELILESQDGHQSDISTYIESKLRIKGPSSGEVRSQIQSRAGGVFIWVVLVVEILNIEFKRGRIFQIQRRLNTIPSKLGDLFKEILERDRENPEDLQISIQSILFAGRPLRLEEFYCAVLCGLGYELNEEETSRDDMKRFALSSSKGLAEVTEDTSTVQFIHESVREFFLKDGLSQVWPDLASTDFEIISHEQLKNRCLAYVQLFTSRYPDPTSWPDGQKILGTAIKNNFPLIEYATNYVFHHANAAAPNFQQGSFLQNFPLRYWCDIYNILNTEHRPHYTQSSTLLYVLAENNFIPLINCALRLNPNMNIWGTDDQYSLFAALVNGHREAFIALVAREADLLKDEIHAAFQTPFKPSAGQTPISWAAEMGHKGIFQLLLKHGNNIEDKDDRGGTALIYSAKNGHADIVQLLLDMNADIEQRFYGQTPLSWAITNGHKRIVDMLSARGADPNKYDDNGRTCLSWAAENGRWKTIQGLLRAGVDPEIADVNGQTPLAWAISSVQTRVVQLLLDNGVNAEKKDNSGWTPLSLAARVPHSGAVKLLLEKIVDVEASDDQGRTPLSWAAGHGLKDTVQLLLDKGADPSNKDIDGLSPLSWAARYGCSEVVLLLLGRGICPDMTDNKGMTPLSWAARNGHTSAVQLLMAQGASTVIRDKLGHTPLGLARLYHNKGAIELLSPSGDF